MILDTLFNEWNNLMEQCFKGIGPEVEKEERE